MSIVATRPEVKHTQLMISKQWRQIQIQHIQHVVGHANPSFTRFMKCIKMEQKNTEHRIGLALSGKIKGNVTQKAESRQRALKNLIDDYGNRDILDFLRGVSHNGDA